LSVQRLAAFCSPAAAADDDDDNDEMPADLENSNSSSSETESLLGRGQRRVKRFFDGFVDFAFQGNILQIAFGLMCVT